MARVRLLPLDNDSLKGDLSLLFQSGHINFLIGAGASSPAIVPAGQIEQEVGQLRSEGKDADADRTLCDLLAAIQTSCNRVLQNATEPADEDTLKSYVALLRHIETTLGERRTNVLPKQATIFTTNYDIFLDVAMRSCGGLRLATGFDTVQTADDECEYSSNAFSQATYDTGNLYDYRVELPSLNLVKLHGCLSWKRDGERIIRRPILRDVPQTFTTTEEASSFLALYDLVVPQQSKYHTAIMDRTYYELLRLYANALDRSNVLLIVFGFSFRDEHVLHITRRALKNPTLRIVVFAYDTAAHEFLSNAFLAHNNVDVVAPTDGEKIDFDGFNEILKGSLPQRTLPK